MSNLITKEQLGILSLKEREGLMDSWLMHRLDILIPAIMKKHDVDMWIIAGREYNEDPLLETFFPSAIDSSRRLTIIVFYKDEANQIERLVIHSNPKFEPFYKRAWGYKGETQWECLTRIIREKKPRCAALNYSKVHAACDGLTHSLFQKIHTILENLSVTGISAEKMAVEWLEMRTGPELEFYPQIADITRIIAAEALEHVITPGVTNSEDVVEWIRQRVFDLGLKTSFYPTVDLQRQGEKNNRMETVILPGDIVHIDFGLYYLGLATDTQLLAYVLRKGEESPPKGVIDAMKTAIRMEDIIAGHFAEGCSGNDIFQSSVEQAGREGIKAMVYSHPLGVHCHGAGPVMGLYDCQGDIPVRGAYSIKNNTCYAMEFNVTQYIPEWGQDVTLYMEESITFKGGKVSFLTNRQIEFYLI
ncbi:M24 family metallopeptidase [Peribacillus deserti]|uniref:Xaa-Pro aminopeptidase n=1 Tax=Peribacillus deserti TaxID=673318 RepID=A0A2N5M2I1_9BACI|nr:M24 family metallopeptidase [Peribacillus deserti]PLT28569.1 Xaa-Pro aminopeptidase [Peribacillus deserti]